jgi:hypothetical protein
MRRTIETAPTNGKFVIIEEQATGKYDVACWSLEAAGWIDENGEPAKVFPTHWYPIQGENYLQQGPTLPTVRAQTTQVEAKSALQAWRRFAACLIAACFVTAAFTGIYFRTEVAYEVERLRKGAEAETTELQQERVHSTALADEVATVRRDLETTTAIFRKEGEEVAQLRKAAEAKAAESQQERDYTAAIASPAPAVAALVATPPTRKLDPDELATFMDRAKRLVATGDISPARLLLERAADARESTAALMLAQTYDPDVLGPQDLHNNLADPALARLWYQRAADLGSARRANPP